MHKVIFYPVGNGDTSQVILENGKRLLFDFRHKRKTETETCPEVNLKEKLKKDLEDAGRDYDLNPKPVPDEMLVRPWLRVESLD